MPLPNPPTTFGSKALLSRCEIACPTAAHSAWCGRGAAQLPRANGQAKDGGKKPIVSHRLVVASRSSQLRYTPLYGLLAECRPRERVASSCTTQAWGGNTSERSQRRNQSALVTNPVLRARRQTTRYKYIRQNITLPKTTYH